MDDVMFPRKRQTSVQERAAIAAFHDAGKPPREIAQRLGRDIKTIQLWINRWTNSGDVLRNAGSGRPRVTTPEQDEMIRDAVNAKPITSVQEIMGKE